MDSPSSHTPPAGLRGACHCGAVQVRLPPGAAGVIACHCDDCQRMHGNFFALIAAPAAEVQLDGGDALTWYASSPKARRAFCARCGSRVAKQAVGADRLLLSAGLFGRETGMKLVRHLFADSRPDWYALPSLG